MENIRNIAKAIELELVNHGFDSIIDSSGYYIIREFEDGTDRAVNVYKSADNGKNHYVIYCSYEDESSDWLYTDSLSTNELIEVLTKCYNAKMTKDELNESITSYTWKTPEEVIDLLLTVPDGTSVDFTFDTPENECENFEPSGWYGVRLTYMFGNNVICMGTWGGGNVYSKEYFEDEEMYTIFNDYCKKHGQNHILCVSDKYNGS